MKKAEGLMKISELSKATGLSSTTIKYYVSMGLVDIALKTSANMAYYSSDSIERIALIRTLQKQRFYPLSYIKQILQLNGGQALDLDLMDAIYKYNPKRRSADFSVSNACRISGLNASQIHLLEITGIIQISDGMISQNNCDILCLVKGRLDAGLSLEHTIDAFSAYQKSLEKAVQMDIDSMVSKSFLTQSLSPEKMVRMIRESDTSLTRFVEIKREQLNMKHGELRLKAAEGFVEKMRLFVNDSLLPQYKEKMITENEEQVIIPKDIQMMLTDVGRCSITVAIHLIRTAYQYCVSSLHSPDGSYIQKGLAYGFFALLPDMIFSEELLAQARKRFPDCMIFEERIRELKSEEI
ncbi:MAG: MerR family transcriptional regulator [Sphaerochaetaceae bacterium]|nr:MerR family transcriptional regulator [Sphaerochaetaceae bacterium]MDD3162891.1 MerR family transcriptional regulator [Sphaerochaetaceae bacterium]MDD4007122.1 MerR family transcriptional regulator [Sphaerochaetaceae bacterium]MDD4396777.1 MerR family transcriptional regulator [Sphaerochaetaceae bacterium]